MQTTIQSTSSLDTQKKHQELKRHTASSDYYALLRLLLQAPNRELIGGLVQGLIFDDFKSICEELNIDRESTDEMRSLFASLHSSLDDSEETQSTLRREYTRLFSHPKKPLIPFFESTFIDAERVRSGKRSTQARLFVNPIAMAAERSYKEAGLSIGAHLNLPADCITTELEFMGYLHTQIAQALMDGDEAKVAHTNELMSDFWENHIATWIPRFSERCIEEDQTGLYSAVGAMSKLLFSYETERLAETRI